MNTVKRMESMSYTCMNTKSSVHPYRLQQREVFFSDLSCLDIIKMVLDKKGQIVNFPRSIKDERWEDIHRTGQCYDARFCSMIHHLNNDEYLIL